MTGPTTYPRLPRAVAEALLEEQRQLSVDRLAELAATSHPQQEWHPTIPARATGWQLQLLRSDVIGIAVRHGYPVQQPRGGHATFDQELAVHLYERMGIVPAEAAIGGVWSFLAMVLLPDVAAWRYADRHPDRFIGPDLMIGSSNRHVFGRLWARVHILGAETSSGLREDNVVNLFERSTFGGDPRIARAIGETHIRTMAARQVAQSQELMRDAMKRLRRLAVLVSFSAMNDDQLRDLLEEVFTSSATALRAAPLTEEPLGRAGVSAPAS